MQSIKKSESQYYYNNDLNFLMHYIHLCKTSFTKQTW